MKNFCPKCGAHLKPGAEFCPKCGTKIKKNQPINNMAQQAEPTPQKLTVFQKYKAFIISMGAIIVVGLCAGIFFLVKQNGGGHFKTASALVRKKAKKHPKNEKQDDGQSSSASSSTSSDYSPSEWMLMGYMAYARDNYKESRDADTTSELVDDVQEDIDDGDLKVSANSDNTYTLSNKFGSVDVIVGSDDVKVNSDHGDDSRNSKDDLKSTFSSYQDKIQEMTKHIENNGSSSDSDDKDDKDDEDKKETSSSSNDDKDVQFNDEEYIVAAFIQHNPKSSVSEKLNHVSTVVAKGTKAPSDDYLTFGNDDQRHKKYIATNVGTSQYTIFTLSTDSIKGTMYGAGVKGEEYTYSRKDLLKTYGSHKDEIDKVIAGMKYNSKHLADYNKDNGY